MRAGLTLLKGLLVVAFPEASVSAANAAVDAAIWWQPVYVVFAGVGLYLAYAGWAPSSGHPAPQTGETTQDLPRAA